MKKTMSIILAVMMAMVMLLTAAVAEDVIPQPEGGKKFESNWGMMDGVVQITYEEEGYRVHVDLYNEADKTGTVWEYSCYYVEADDALESISSSKRGYSVDENGEDVFGDEEYEGFDEEGQTSAFTIDGNGMLCWKDGRENAGADLAFSNIGNFEGVWANEAEEVEVEIFWEGRRNENTFYYAAYIFRGAGDTLVQFTMQGLYNPETGKLEVAEAYNPDGSETYDAFFSMTEDGKLLYETANGIELEYKGLPQENG